MVVSQAVFCKWEAAVTAWEAKDSLEGSPRSDLPVFMSVWGDLDCSLMVEGSFHCGGNHSLAYLRKLIKFYKLDLSQQAAFLHSSGFK